MKGVVLVLLLATAVAVAVAERTALQAPPMQKKECALLLNRSWTYAPLSAETL